MVVYELVMLTILEETVRMFYRDPDCGILRPTFALDLVGFARICARAKTTTACATFS